MRYPNLFKKLFRRVLDRINGEQFSPKWQGVGAAVKTTQMQLFMYWRSLVASGQELPSINDTGYRIFSGTDDDGRLLYLFAVLGFKTRKFVDIGSGDGINNNCANLILNFGFHGLMIDGDPQNIESARQFYSKHIDSKMYPPQFDCEFIKAENINQIITRHGIQGEIDLLSIDIDGNDYWVWKAIECIQPRIVIIETHIEFGRNNIVVPYDADYCYPGKHPQYHGASPMAMINLGKAKGYRLAGTNSYGFNFIFVRQGEGDKQVPEINLDQALAHPRNLERSRLFEKIKDWKYEKG